MARSFVNISTSTNGKIEFETSLLEAIPKCKNPTYKFISMVGSVDGIDRHIDFAKTLNISVLNIIFVERDLSTYISLKEAIDKRELPIKVIHGDFAAALKKELLNGTVFQMVDFDGTEGIGRYHYDLVDLCHKYRKQVEFLHIVASVRIAKDKAYLNKLMAQNLDMEEVARPKYVKKHLRPIGSRDNYQRKMLCEPGAKDVFSCWIKEVTLFSVTTRQYKGRQPMLSFLLKQHKTYK